MEGRAGDDSLQLVEQWSRTVPASTAVPDVTVIIPIYNKGPYLAECLSSVLGQAGVALEVVCVDDCSSDDSAAVLDRYAGQAAIRVTRNSSRRGAAFSRNVGLEQARGRYVQFTDADDLLPLGALATLHSLAVSEKADITRGTLRAFTGESSYPMPTERIDSARRGALLDLPEIWIPWFHTCYLIDRSLLAEHGIRYPPLTAGEDPVFIARVLTTARAIALTPAVTYMYRMSQQRPTPSAQTVRDYVTHVAMVRDIFRGAFLPCWTSYSSFIRDDVQLLLDQSTASDDDRRMLSRLLDDATGA